MATEIKKDKEISKLRQEKVEHDFEALVGSRRRRYCNTPEQIRRTEFFEDYYLLYTRQKQQIKELEEENKVLQERISNLIAERDYYLKNRDKLYLKCNLLLTQLHELPKKICEEIREELSIVSFIHDIEKNDELINDIGVVIQKVQAKFEKEVKGESDE